MTGRTVGRQAAQNQRGDLAAVLGINRRKRMNALTTLVAAAAAGGLTLGVAADNPQLSTNRVDWQIGLLEAPS